VKNLSVPGDNGDAEPPKSPGGRRGSAVNLASLVSNSNSTSLNSTGNGGRRNKDQQMDAFAVSKIEKQM